MLRVWGLAVVALLSGCSAPAPTVDDAKQATILSANPCIDAILVELVDPKRIVSVSHYSQRAGSSSMNIAVANRFPANGGTAEEIIAHHPDIALLGAHTPDATIEAVRAAGISTHLIGVPASLSDSLEQIDAIGAAVGAPRAAGLLGQQLLSEVGDAPQAADRPSVLVWQSGGLVPGHGTLIADLVERAGFRNASADYGLSSWDLLPLEPVVANPPDIILTPTNGDTREGRLRRAFAERFGSRTRVHAMPENLLHCGGPTIIRAMRALRAARP